MDMSRRRFLDIAGCAGAMTAAGCSGVRNASYADVRRAGVATEQLEQVAVRPTLNLTVLETPLTIESIRLLCKNGEFFVHVRSREGAEGVSGSFTCCISLPTRRISACIRNTNAISNGTAIGSIRRCRLPGGALVVPSGRGVGIVDIAALVRDARVVEG